MAELPLRVRVAAALGWTNLIPPKPGGRWRGTPPGIDAKAIAELGPWNVPLYDRQWTATGRLIERYDIQVGPTYGGLGTLPPWTAVVGIREDRDGDDFAHGETPLIAICNLLLQLHAAGKLAA